MISYDLIGCPACGGDLYRSRRQGIFERYIFAVVQMRAYRCHRCRARFLCLPTFIFRKRDLEEEEERKKKKARAQAQPSESVAAPTDAPTPH